MATTLTDDEAEELAGYLPDDILEDSRYALWLKGSMLRVGRCYFRGAYVYALAVMVMHKAALADLAEDGAAGAVTSKREGDLSVSYSAGSSSDDSDLSLTVFGREYLGLLMQYSPRPGVTGRGA